MSELRKRIELLPRIDKRGEPVLVVKCDITSPSSADTDAMTKFYERLISKDLFEIDLQHDCIWEPSHEDLASLPEEVLSLARTTNEDGTTTIDPNKLPDPYKRIYMTLVISLVPAKKKQKEEN